MRRTLVRLANPVLHNPAIPQSQTTTTKPPASSSSRLKQKSRAPPLSLEHFLLRSRVLILYRTILRAIYAIPDPEARKDPVAHAKAEFMRNKDVRDTAQIRYLASTGKAEWDGMRRYIDELAVMGGGKK